MMISFAQKLSKNLVDSNSLLFTDFFMCDNSRKNGPQNFFHLKNRLFFSKIWIFINLLGPKELIFLLSQYLSEYLLDLYKSSHEVCHNRYYERKEALKFFIHRKDSLFFKNLWFQQPPRSRKNALASYTVMVRTTCWPFQVVFRGLSYSIIRGKLGQSFCHLKTAIFWKVSFYRLLIS